MNKERQEGYYWVKYEGEWIIGYWCGIDFLG